jgi:hypothetical protein
MACADQCNLPRFNWREREAAEAEEETAAMAIGWRKHDTLQSIVGTLVHCAQQPGGGMEGFSGIVVGPIWSDGWMGGRDVWKPYSSWVGGVYCL